jgi:hypothetical protein
VGGGGFKDDDDAAMDSGSFGGGGDVACKAATGGGDFNKDDAVGGGGGFGSGCTADAALTAAANDTMLGGRGRTGKGTTNSESSSSSKPVVLNPAVVVVLGVWDIWRVYQKRLGDVCKCSNGEKRECVRWWCSAVVRVSHLPCHVVMAYIHCLANVDRKWAIGHVMFVHVGINVNGPNSPSGECSTDRYSVLCRVTPRSVYKIQFP